MALKPEQTTPTLRRHLKSIVITASSVLVFFVVIFVAGKPDFECLLNADLFWLATGLASIALSIFFLVLRWLLFIRFFSYFPPVSETYSFLSGLSLCTMFLPKELVEIFGRTWWLKHKHAVPYSAGASTVFADRLMDIVGLGVILPPSVGFIFFKFSSLTLMICLGCCAIIGAALLALGGSRIFILLYAFCKWLNDTFMHLLKRRSNSTHFMIDEIPQTTFLWAYLFTLTKFFLIIFSYWAFARSLGMQTSLFSFIMIVPAIQLCFLVSFTAGGLGFIETGWYFSLKMLETNSAGISTYLVAQRVFFTLALAITAFTAYGISFYCSNYMKKNRG